MLNIAVTIIMSCCLLNKLSLATKIIAKPLVSRVLLKPLPTLYIYDHCPFCVRVRLALGLKNIKHDLRFLLNDDIDTPTGLVGKKIAPIFSFQSEHESYTMPESLDIIEKIDSNPIFGPVRLFKPMSSRNDLKDWQKKYAEMQRILQRPRYMMSVLPEFATKEAKDAFVFNHSLHPYEKEEWKNKLSYEQRWALYHEAYVISLKSIEDGSLTKALEELNDLIYCEDYCTEGGLSLDDIDLWARLRSLTLVKGIHLPDKVNSYMKSLSTLGDVPLYDSLAC